MSTPGEPLARERNSEDLPVFVPVDADMLRGVVGDEIDDEAIADARQAGVKTVAGKAQTRFAVPLTLATLSHAVR